MRDTSPEIDAAFTALFAKQSGADRVRMTCEMFDAAKALVAADIQANYPGISAAELRLEMFDRLYLGDFDTDSRTRIRSALR